MRLVVGMDGDGHFFVENINNRMSIWHFITEELHDGDMWANRDDEDEYPDDMNYMALSDLEWEDLLSQFIQDGDMEFIDKSII